MLPKSCRKMLPKCCRKNVAEKMLPKKCCRKNVAENVAEKMLPKMLLKKCCRKKVAKMLPKIVPKCCRKFCRKNFPKFFDFKFFFASRLKKIKNSSAAKKNNYNSRHINENGLFVHFWWKNSKVTEWSYHILGAHRNVPESFWYLIDIRFMNQSK